MRWEPHERGTSSAAPAPGPLWSGRVGGGPRGAGVAACTALPSKVPAAARGVRAARLDAGRDDRGDLGAAASGPVDMKTGFDSGRAARLDAGRDDRGDRGGGGAVVGAGASGALACAVETPPRASAASRLLPRGCSASTSPPSTLLKRGS